MYVMRVELHDDLAAGGCPVCRGATRSTRAWLSDLLRQIDDGRVQDGLERDGGLCAHHVRWLIEVARECGDSLGLGIVLEQLLQIELSGRGASLRRSGRGGWLRRMRLRRVPPMSPDDPCAACRAELVRVDAYLTLLVDEPDEATHRLADRPGAALCRPHLRMALARRLHHETALLQRATDLHVRSLIARLRASQRAHTYGAPVERGVHEVLWRDAPDWLAGPR